MDFIFYFAIVINCARSYLLDAEMVMKTVVFILFCLILTIKVWGQERFYFSKLNVKDGLSQSSVTAIFQDSDGYLWFGTSNGLNKFDGYGFKVYRKSLSEKNSLAHDEISKIAQDTAKNLWVLTPRGLNRIDHETDEISFYPLVSEKIKDILCHAGKLWTFTNKNIYYYEPSCDTLRCQPIAFQITSPISAVTADKEGYVYIGTDQDGIYVCDSNFQLIRHIFADDSAKGLSADIVRHLFVDEEKNLWVILDNKGVECYQLESGKVSRPSNVNYAAIGNHLRTAIDWDRQHLLLGTFNGLALLNKEDLSIRPVPSNLGEKGGLSHYSVYHLFKDRQQTLWVGTYSGGLNYHNRYNNRFEFIAAKNYSGVIRKGAEDKDGVLWFATEGGGLLSYDPQTGMQENYLLKKENSIYYNNLLKTLLISGDTIFCTSFGGRVYAFSRKTKEFNLLHDFKYNDIYTLYKDSKGRLWIPTNTQRGLVIAQGTSLQENFKVDSSLRKFTGVTVVEELPGDRFLIGTISQGFYLYSPNERKVRQFSSQELGLPRNEKVFISAFYTDKQQNIWVSTNGHGLWQFDSQLNLKKHYTTEDGLMDQKVFYVTEDKEGFLWVMSCNELYRLDVRLGILNRFNSRNGIELQEFSVFSGLKTRNGKLYLSGMNGFQSIDPLELKPNTEAPKVLLTTLHINNKDITPQTPGSPLQKKLQQTTHLVLKHDQTNLSISYTALNYIYPEQNQYAYKLEGTDPDWNYVQNRRTAYYSNLKPGDYLFRVIASNNDGVWNKEGTSIRITVLPPYWLRWWAYLIYIGVVSFVLWKFFAWRHKKRELETNLRIRQLEQEKQEEMNRERNQFFTHVTHEFRTPLTLILNPVDDLLGNEQLSPEMKESVGLIRKNGQRLLSLVNNLLDIQRHKTGKKELQRTSFDFKEFLQEIYYNFQATAPLRELTFDLDFPLPELLVTYDREELEKVFFNLLSNAFKFTPAGGHIELRCRRLPQDVCSEFPENTIPDFSMAEQWLYISVSDTGIGISEADREKLFEPFHHSANDLHQKTAGSGIGLNLSRTIVEQHEGKIFARPLNPGTEIGILLPLCYDPSAPRSKNEVVNEEAESGTTGQEPISEDTPTILLVEDNPEILSYISRKLESSYRVLTATNGQQAFEIASQQFPDIVVSDIMMPVMNGVELCYKLKNTLAISHIPIILLTAKSMAMHMEEGFNAGADDYIVKPFSLSLLKVRIKNILAGRQRMKEIYYKRFSLDNIGVKIESVDDMFMDKYMEIVRLHIAEPDFGIDDICREIGFSRANFYRKLKLVTNLSPVEMIRNIRLENAAKLLRESDLTVSEIAFKVGFNNHSYFTSCFKTLYGISPTEFQEKERMGQN